MFIVYKTTNLTNNKFYLGVHGCTKKCAKACNYIGSGIVLKQAIKKYGKSNFIRETLMEFNTSDILNHILTALLRIMKQRSSKIHVIIIITTIILARKSIAIRPILTTLLAKLIIIYIRFKHKKSKQSIVTGKQIGRAHV